MYCSITDLHIPHGIICVIGSGGKTTLMRFLSDHLTGTVILTTSTHMYPFAGIPLIDTAAIDTAEGKEDLCGRISSMFSQNRTLCIGRLLPDGKLSDPSGSIPFARLAEMTDYILVEGDGSKCLPLKAHRPHEPVIPEGTALTIGLIGASGIGRPLRDVCHCPSRFAALAGAMEDEPVTERHIADVINAEDLADWYFVNQTDTLPDSEIAICLCRLIRKKASAGSLLEHRFL